MLLLSSRQSGKSTAASALALKAALLEAPALILLLSPTLRQSGELFRDKVKRLHNALGRPVAVTQESALQMELANGSRVISLPGNEGNIRGYSSARLLVIDEAARVPDPSAPTPEWPELALAPLRVGGIVELLPAQWLPLDERADSALDDRRGGHLRYRREPGFAGYVFDDGTRIEAPPGRLSISPGGRWLALEAKPGVLLWDRDLRQRHRLRRRHLCGWHDEAPWLQGSDASMPLPLRDALRRERVG